MIVGFIAHLHKLGYSGSTITTHVSAISYYHKMLGTNDPTKQFIVTKLLSGASKLQTGSMIRLPITISILKRLVNTVSELGVSTYDSHLIKSMFMLAFYAFLRIGELTYQGKTCSPHVLQVTYVSFTRVKSKITGMIISFRSFKHSQHGSISNIKIEHEESEMCPVDILCRYLAVRPKGEGSLFVFKDNQPVTSSFFYDIYVKCLRKLNLDPHVCKGHSFRIGAATHSAMLGYSDSQIASMGRWKSSAFKKYIRIPTSVF